MGKLIFTMKGMISGHMAKQKEKARQKEMMSSHMVERALTTNKAVVKNPFGKSLGVSAYMKLAEKELEEQSKSAANKK